MHFIIIIIFECTLERIGMIPHHPLRSTQDYLGNWKESNYESNWAREPRFHVFWVSTIFKGASPVAQQ